jgi:hypothetical protein
MLDQVRCVAGSCRSPGWPAGAAAANLAQCRGQGSVEPGPPQRRSLFDSMSSWGTHRGTHAAGITGTGGTSGARDHAISSQLRGLRYWGWCRGAGCSHSVPTGRLSVYAPANESPALPGLFVAGAVLGSNQ